MKRAALLMLAAAACSTPVDRKLPGGTLTPPMTPRVAKLHPSAVACGDDVTLDGSDAPNIRYLYAYDELGRLAHATGTYTAGGADDAIDYGYDHLDHMTAMTQSRGWGNTRVAITADYDTLGDLVTYTTEQTSLGYHDLLAYTYAQLTASGEPTAETITDSAQGSATYQLTYDASGRIAVVTSGTQTQTYTYDDDARTTTIDTNHGAFHGVIEYDDLNRELSEVWGGTDPAAVASAETYEYESDRLLSMAYHSGASSEIDTLRYDCSVSAPVN